MTRALMVMAVLGQATLAAAQQQPTPEQMNAMLEQMKPGQEHRTLAALTGNWTLDVTYRMGDGPVMKTTGVATNRMILGGRFLESSVTSKNPAGPGSGDPTVESLTIYGFDRRVNRYTILGLDTMGTYSVSAEGLMEGANTIVMAGETLDDHAGSKEMRKYHMVLRVVDPDTYVTEIIFKFRDKPDLKLVEIVHRRVK
jgi:hypothetical protein